MVNAQQLYIATDDDGYTLEDDQPTPVLAGELPAEHQWLYGEEDGQDFDEDDGDGGHWILPEQPLTDETDLRDETYLDPLALVNAWEGAMMDLKVRIPSFCPQPSSTHRLPLCRRCTRSASSFPLKRRSPSYRSKQKHPCPSFSLPRLFPY